jgi:hypothetical protein
LERSPAPSSCGSSERENRTEPEQNRTEQNRTGPEQGNTKDTNKTNGKTREKEKGPEFKISHFPKQNFPPCQKKKQTLES